MCSSIFARQAHERSLCPFTCDAINNATDNVANSPVGLMDCMVRTIERSCTAGSRKKKKTAENRLHGTIGWVDDAVVLVVMVLRLL